MASPPSAVSREQGFLHLYRQSAEAVRRAHARAEQAGQRALAMRVSLARLQPPHGENQVPGLVQLMIEESERANREKERFIAVASHELRQPLKAALAACTSIAASSPTPAPERATEVT